MKGKLMKLLVVGIAGTLFLAVSAFSIAQDNVIVYPSSFAAENANNIEDALNACPSGGEVVLSEGTFEVDRVIVVEGFECTLRGAGIDRTIIKAISGEYDLIDVPYFSDSGLFTFVYPQGDVKFKDFTMQTDSTVNYASEPWYYYGYETRALSTFISLFGGDYNSTFDSIKFQGQEGDFWGVNVQRGIEIFGGEPEIDDLFGTGTHTIKNCQMEDLAQSSSIGLWIDSKVTIKNSESHVVGPSALVWNFFGTEVSIKDNKFSSGSTESRWLETISLLNIDFPEISAYTPSKVTIKNNEIEVFGDAPSSSGTSAIYLAEPPFTPPEFENNFEVVIEDNKFTLHDADIGIEGGDIDGAVIKNNRFIGTSTYGAIYAWIYGPDELTTGWIVTGNNWKQLDTPSGIKLVLEEWSREWLVVGSKKDIAGVEDVPAYDGEGNLIDKNNTIKID